MASARISARKKGEPLLLFISPTVVSDWKERGVFPELSPEQHGGCLMTAAIVNEVYEDACYRVKTLSGVDGRGRKIAFNSLTKWIERRFGLALAPKRHIPGFSPIELVEPEQSEEIMSWVHVIRLMKRTGIPVHVRD